MSVAVAFPPPSIAAIYLSSSSTSAMPSIAVVGLNSVTQVSRLSLDPHSGKSALDEDPVFKAFFREVSALQDDQEEDTPPDATALGEVLRLVPLSRSQLAGRWTKPRVATDGFGGVRLTWQRGNAEVRAVISGSQTSRRSYLYWEDGEQYGTIPNFTATTLLTHLDKLEKAPH